MVGRPFWQFPEWISFLVCMIQRIDVHQLLNIVAKELLELLSGVVNALIEIHWLFLSKLDSIFQSTFFLFR